MLILADVNGDGKDDIVCRAADGGIMLWEAKDVHNFYGPEAVWSNEAFGFCTNNPKMGMSQITNLRISGSSRESFVIITVN